MRARKISNRGGFKVIGKFPSFKLGRMVWYESQLERDFCYLLEFDRDVISYSEQPFKLDYTLNGKRRRYTPDFLVIRSSRNPLVIEVKPESKIRNTDFKNFEKAVKTELESEGKEFRTITCSQIQKEPRISNEWTASYKWQNHSTLSSEETPLTSFVRSVRPALAASWSLDLNSRNRKSILYLTTSYKK